jgi:hypothetical protein
MCVIPFPTETNTDFMQRLSDQPEEIGCKICFMWCDAKYFCDNEAAEIAQCQCSNDMERAEEITETGFREGCWDCDGWHEF